MTKPVIASVRIAAPPEVVFPYFTDPALAVKWIANTAYLDARPGGTLAIDWQDEVFAQSCLTHAGAIRHEPTRALVEAP